MRTFQGLGICDTNYRYLPLGGRLGNANQPVRGNHFPGDDALAAKFPSGGPCILRYLSLIGDA